jgi:hypothetical protein
MTFTIGGLPKRLPTVEKELDLSLGPVSRAFIRESLSIQRVDPPSKIVQIQRGVKGKNKKIPYLSYT